MEQIYNFDTPVVTITNGGYKKGRWIVWLNLGVSEILDVSESQTSKFQAVTDRLVLSSNSLDAFLECVSPSHLAVASNQELLAILKYFKTEGNLDSWKALRQIQVLGYDNSPMVNQFYLNGAPLWLDKATRVGLANSITMEKNAGRVNTDLWFGNMHIAMSVDTALTALTQLELYAKDCYNVTAQHLAAIDDCQSIEDLRKFDITADYPEMIQLEIRE